MTATRTDLVIPQGADLAQSLAIADTTGRTYEVSAFDRFGNQVSTGLAVAVNDETTIALTLAAAYTALLMRPANFSHAQRQGRWGSYVVTETVTATGAVSRVYEGDLIISLEGP